MKRWSRILLALACIPAVAGVALACGDDDDSGDLKSVTLMLDWTPNTNHAGIFIAKEKGYYRDAGLDVKIVEPASGGVEQVVGTGKADFGISAQEYVIPARAEDVPIVSVAAILQHNTSSLFSLAKDNITRPRDLDNKTYGGFGGPLETALVKKLSQCDGGKPDSIKFVEIGDVDYLVGMEQDRYDFVWIFDGWDGVRAKEIEKKAVNTIPFIQYAQCIPDWYTPVIISNEKLLKDDPETVSKFMEATTKGYEEAIKNPQASYDAIIANAPETDKALLKASAEYLASHYVDSGRQWGQQDAATWSGFAKFLKEAGLFEKDVDTTKAFSNAYLPKR